MSEQFCPQFAPFFGFAGATLAMVLTATGSAIGTAKAGAGIVGMGQFKPQLIMKSLVPVVMASIVGIYGLVVAVLISQSLSPDRPYSLFSGAVHLAAGLTTGLSGLAAGWAIGIVGDASVRQYTFQDRIFIGMVLVLIFAEVLGLYGLIVSLILNSKAGDYKCS
ncbi:hypothetical protein MIR68_000331 [Amoeboaphelidium protococcarum]|nr:hypothetical protein MIR68_003400 [Amoeboaphelidium protococcarum]KAI3641634.1 hypothetical protein MIR68_000331 [Amoeboaphelidium protococcarum]KAI3651387.1 hypothetical protein MP228_003759 [Amoeboaphelidium protococcarum]KAI3654224.1 hypothetical protein MP228_000943 [Amoeboaphelidium protococcarum]